MLNNDLSVVRIDADSNRVGINYFCRNAEVNFSGIILRHIVLIMMKDKIKNPLVVRMRYQSIANDTKV